MNDRLRQLEIDVIAELGRIEDCKWDILPQLKRVLEVNDIWEINDELRQQGVHHKVIDYINNLYLYLPYGKK